MTIAIFSIKALTPESICLSPYISKIIQTVYKTPKINPPFKLSLLHSFSFLKKITARTRNARINRIARMLIGDMDSINIFEKRKDVPLAIKTVVNSIFAPVLLMLSLLLFHLLFSITGIYTGLFRNATFLFYSFLFYISWICYFFFLNLEYCIAK